MVMMEMELACIMSAAESGTRTEALLLPYHALATQPSLRSGEPASQRWAYPTAQVVRYMPRHGA